MVKLSLLASVCVIVAAPALASKQRQESCSVTASIVSKAVDARMAGRTLDQTKAELDSDASGIEGVYKLTIPTLVDMVYSFEESTLGPDVVEQYEAQCLNF